MTGLGDSTFTTSDAVLRPPSTDGLEDTYGATRKRAAEMPSEDTNSRTPTPRQILERLADERRLRVLGLLRELESPATVEALAVRLAALETETAEAAVTDEDVRTIRIDLVHGQLPLLACAGLIEWDREERAVRTTDHPLLRQLPPDHRLPPAVDGWAEVLADLLDDRRRATLAVLKAGDGPMTETDLARAVARRLGVEPTDETVDAHRASLQHVHLPNLEETGLVEHDRERATVHYVGHDALDVDRFTDLGSVSATGGWPDVFRLAG